MRADPEHWRILGASVAGTSHRSRGLGCDDANAYRLLADGTAILAVADGAGSASRAAEGAACAVRSALLRVESGLQESTPCDEAGWCELLQALLQDIRSDLEQLAIRSQASSNALEYPPASSRPLADLATTLLVAIAGREWLSALQVGDGAIVIDEGAGRGMQVLLRPPRAEYVNETTFVTSDSYRTESLTLARPRGPVQGIALLTDGLEALSLQLATREPHVPFFSPLFDFARKADATEQELGVFLESERVCARTDDDKTLLLAVRP